MSIIKIGSTIVQRPAVQQAIKKSKQIIQDINTGSEYGARLARRQNLGKIKTAQLRFIGANRKLPENFWFTLIGTCSPVPFGTFLGYGLGKFINNLRKTLK